MQYFEYLVRSKYKNVKNFCRESGLDHASVYGYMSGRRFPSVSSFMLCTEVLNITAEDLWKNWYKEFSINENK